MSPFPYRTTRYYRSLADLSDSEDPVRRQIAIDPREDDPAPHLRTDPLDEASHSPLPGLIRRFPDRALVLAHGECPVHCRHCFRRHRLGYGALPGEALEDIVTWLRDHPEVREVLVSGGEPLLLGPQALDHLLGRLRSVPTVRWLRLATRMPVVDPSRITRSLARMLRGHAPLHVATHFNHPRELTLRARRALAHLVDAGLPVANQAVLLRGVNDDVDTLEALFCGLLEARVRPYQLYQCDLVAGTDHLRVPTPTALDLMDHLRVRLSGLALPALSVDHPEAPSKIPL
ncbi:MAG: KamA family radical SAM protein, partial [Deltaproteobacteria bacterium]|nr:KamA family radical SAM protein [Deltaproteobacteria bacterium]